MCSSLPCTDARGAGTDQLLLDIADYVVGYELQSAEAVKTARYSMLDALGASRRLPALALVTPLIPARPPGCALLALNVPEARTLLGPVVPGAHGGPHGAHVPGTSLLLDPVACAFSTGCLVSWLDYNDCWLGAEWCGHKRHTSLLHTLTRPSPCPLVLRIHPSDTLCALLATADYASSVRRSRGAPPLLVRDVLVAAVKAYEISGLLAADNSLNAIGVDGTLFTKVAAAACCARLLGGGRREVASAASQAFVDGSSLRCFRHAPAGGSRKGWAAGDAGARAVWLALATMRGEPGVPQALSAPVWGFQDVFFRRAQLQLPRALGEHVAPRLLFRAALPAEPHAAAAAEACLSLHPLVVHRLEEIQSVAVHTSRAGVRAADRTGPLPCAADRDHSLQYCVAVALLYGCVTAEHFSDAVAGDPRLEELRRRVAVAEHPPFSAEYADPQLRALPAAVQVHFADRSATPQVSVRCPLGHASRRPEGFPALDAKLLAALRSRFPQRRAAQLYDTLQDAARLDAMAVPDFLELLADPPAPYNLAHQAPGGGTEAPGLPLTETMSALGLSQEGGGEAEGGDEEVAGMDEEQRISAGGGEKGPGGDTARSSRADWRREG